MPAPSFTVRLCIALLVLALAACSPSLNWREVRGNDAPYVVLLPAKPTSFARPVDLGGIKVEMNMTAAEVDDVNFAVASAKIDDASQRQAALATMQAAMLRNIGSDQHREKAVMLKGGVAATEVVASGKAGTTALVLHARFAMHGNRVYQAIALGPAARLSDETADTFLSSFELR
ncbi:MAG: hypothetical protein RL404_1837 [Pseudomonadota bacterium]